MTELTELEVEKETEINSKKESKDYSTSFKVQSYFNTVVHILNGAVACYMTLQLIREIRNGWPNTNDLFPLHAYLTTVGYQLFMVEAILVYYTPNSWTYFLSHKTKKHLHWILHLVGAMFIIAGNVLISVIRTTPHFATIHAITGSVICDQIIIKSENDLSRSRFNFDDTFGYNDASRTRCIFCLRFTLLY